MELRNSSLLVVWMAMITACAHTGSLSSEGPVPRDGMPEDAAVSLVLQPRMAEADGRRRLVLDLVVTNLTRKSVQVHPTVVFATCEVWGNVVTIRHADGAEVLYMGIKEAHKKGPVLYETLKAGQTLAVRDIDLTDFYRLPTAAAQLIFEFEGFVLAGRDFPGPWVQAQSEPFAYLPVDHDAVDPVAPSVGRGIASVQRMESGTIITCNR
jgi:hypothetical protein